MKVYKVELMIIDFDGMDADEIVSVIENTNFANDCIMPEVKSISWKEIGPWHDNHPLNFKSVKADEEFKRLFGQS